jgi:undecaprenyl diphosphate synthase
MKNPEHIAIIIDGNRRFAKKNALKPWNGHEAGKKKVEDLIDYAQELKIKQLTIYTLSLENIRKRPERELKYLYELMYKTFREMDRERLRRESIRLNFLGNLDLIPKKIKALCLDLKRETEKNKELIVNFAIAYGGKQEIVEAVKKIIKNKQPVTEKTITQNLYLSENPDLIIRTGAERRTSNFLPWQSAYSELIFLDKMWPEFTKEDLKDCIEDFKRRNRRFGGQ